MLVEQIYKRIIGEQMPQRVRRPTNPDLGPGRGPAGRLSGESTGLVGLLRRVSVVMTPLGGEAGAEGGTIMVAHPGVVVGLDLPVQVPDRGYPRRRGGSGGSSDRVEAVGPGVDSRMDPSKRRWIAQSTPAAWAEPAWAEPGWAEPGWAEPGWAEPGWAGATWAGAVWLNLA